MKITVESSGALIAENALWANTFWSRTKGLLGRSGLGAGEALVISRCSMVHMFFMRFPIDVIFISTQNIVLGLERELKPWSVSKYYGGANVAVEVPAGTIERAGIECGDKLVIVD